MAYAFNEKLIKFGYTYKGVDYQREMDVSDHTEAEIIAVSAALNGMSDLEMIQVIAYLDFVDNDLQDALDMAHRVVTVTPYTSTEDYVKYRFRETYDMSILCGDWIDESLDYNKAWDAMQADDSASWCPYQLEDSEIIVEITSEY